MEKIDFSAIQLLNPFLLNKPDQKKTRPKEELRGSRKTFFSDILENSMVAGELGPLRSIAPSEEALTELMDEVHSSGSDLKDRPFFDEILRYKKAVRNFVNYVVENCYEVTTVQGNKRKMRVGSEDRWVDPKIHHQIRIIDQKLEELAAGILSEQIKQLTIVSKMDEICGLLVDLTISGVIMENNE